MKRDWLERLAAAPSFGSLPAAPPPSPGPGLGGLAAGAVPDLVRSSHGYRPEFPSGHASPERAREPRLGDFFRCP